ncbi:potassium channel family protein [Endozoicomonas lisbonensis]|uniref:Voltage-gated potassium channel Kch n=1 Tax=Endozoicomonas lisbonensis TaxID=3120522 RepID=A0ABV2SMY4_9GAMM
MLLEASLYGSLMVTVTVILHAAGTTLWLKGLYSLNRSFPHLLHTANFQLLILTSTTLIIVFLHLAEIIVWAAGYYIIPKVEIILSWTDAIYFSMVTFTTLGYGDIVLTGDTRLLTGIQSINGIILSGWSTAMLFMVIQTIWKELFKRPDHYT